MRGKGGVMEPRLAMITMMMMFDGEISFEFMQEKIKR
jgi:hypothetical protein